MYIQTVPYTADPGAGPHGRSVVSRIVLGQNHSIIDFDDADNSVINKVVASLKVNEIDAFVVPHHGSAAHDVEAILALRPKTAIIAVNPANKYGHPAAPILRKLMETLGPENVIFTGSDGHVDLGPDGVKYARYTAANPECYALFVDPSRRRAERLGLTKDVEDYKAIYAVMMKGEDLPPGVPFGGQPNPPAGDSGGDTAQNRPRSPRPPSPASEARKEAFASRIDNNGTALSEQLDAGFIKSGGVQPAVLERSRLFRNGGSAKTAVWITRDEDYDAAAKQSAPFSAAEISAIRDHLQLTGSDPTIERSLTVIASTDSGNLNPVEPELHVTKQNLTPPTVVSGPDRGHTPKGGMVYLTGGKLFATSNASELLGGTLDVCGNAPCITFPGTSSSPFHLPFAFNQLFSEVWNRVHDRAIDTFYLSINPTKAFLKDSLTQPVPTERLQFGTSLNPSAANEVVTAGDIQGTQIGRILWESDVAFKSAGVGFDVLKGRNGQQVRAVSSLSHDEDVNDTDLDVDPGNRWCRLYWESGSLSIAADPGTRSVTFAGHAVTARAQAMVLKSGQLVDFEKGSWCGDAKYIAKQLEGVANTPNSAVATLNELRQLATIQTFIRWARDNGLPQTEQFRSALGARKDVSAKFVVPSWTSGIQSSVPVMVQKQTNRSTNTYLLHISFSSPETLEKCVMPNWKAKDTDLPARGVHKVNGTWQGKGDTFTTIDGWMTELADHVSTCSRGVILPPVAVGAQSLDTLTELSRSGSFGLSPHMQPINIHGGVLLGHNTDSIENSFKSGNELRSPFGRLLFRRNGNDLQFWSSQSSSLGATEARKYVFIHGGSIWKAHLHDGHLRFVIETSPGSVVRQEMRILNPGDNPRGVEWVEARNGQDGSLISHSAIQKCQEAASNGPTCFTLTSMNETALGTLAQSLGYDRASPIEIEHLQEGVWLVDLRLDSVYDEIDQLNSAQDNASRITKLTQYRRWACEGDRLKTAELVIPEVEQDTQDTLLTKQDDQDERDTLVAIRIAILLAGIQESLDDPSSLTDQSFKDVVTILDKLDKVITTLSPESSGLLYKAESDIVDTASQIVTTSKMKSDLAARQALYEEWVTLDEALASGSKNSWAPNSSLN